MAHLSRRLLFQGMVSLPITWRCLRAAVAPDPGRKSPHPYLPNATFGYVTSGTNFGGSDAEPFHMFFTVYGFGSEDEACEAFPEVVAYLEENIDEVIPDELKDYAFKRISVGKLGDERSAYYSEPLEGSRTLLVIVRVGPNILHVDSDAIEGSLDEYVAGYLATFIAGATDDPWSLIPDVSDLPVGWELDEPTCHSDILDFITTPASEWTPRNPMCDGAD